MKQFQLVVTMLLIAAFVTTTAFAGANGVVGQKKATKAHVVGVDLTDQVEGKTPSLDKGQRLTPFAGTIPQYSVSATPLSGTYRIGVGKNFTTIAGALGNLAINGVAGPVTFLLTDASYAEGTLLLGSVAGASATNTITFKPDSLTAVAITVVDDAGNGGGWVFYGSKHIVIDGTRKNGTPGSRDLTISQSGAVAGSDDGTIRLRDGCEDVTIKNTIISGKKGATTGTSNDAIRMTGPPNTDITVDNCQLKDSRQGFDSENTFADYDYGVTLTNNHVKNAGEDGIRLGYASGAFISENFIDSVNWPAVWGPSTSVRPSGIRTRFAYQSRIEKNVIDGVYWLNTSPASGNGGRTYGLRHLGDVGVGPTTNVISNNRIGRVFSANTGWTSPTINNSYGIEAFGGIGDSILHNTVYLTGTALSNGLATAIAQGGSALGYDVQDLVLLNNVFSVDRVGSTFNVGIYDFDGELASSDGNVFYSSTGTASLYGGISAWQAAWGTDAASVDNDPAVLSGTDLHINTAVVSSAYNLGLALASSVPDDVDGDVRSLTTPDAGADEFTGIPLDKEVAPVEVTNLIASGIPISTPQTPKAIVKNNTQFSVAAFNVKMVIKNESDVVVTGGGTVSTGVTLAPFESKELTFTSFTPNTNGPYSITVTTELAGDLLVANDTLVYSQPIVPLVVVPIGGYATDFNDLGDDFGWSGTGDFELSSSFTKLGGVYGGSGKTWATVYTGTTPDDVYRSLEDQPEKPIHAVYSPFFDLSAMTGNVYISFRHSINTEPDWDRSTFQYTTDAGATWQTVGVLNDPNGINWYSQSVYANALGDTSPTNPLAFDVGRWNTYIGFPTVPPGIPGWSSNGEPWGAGVPTGPDGYIYVQVKFNAVAGNPFVQFRYLGFADGYTGYEGWAFDNFSIAPTGGSFTGGTISGVAYSDVNGNGNNDSEPAVTGTKVYLSYFGVVKDSTVTAPVTGAYSFNIVTSNAGLPGTYNVRLGATGVAFTEPYGTSGIADVDHPSDGSAKTQDFGTFIGGISGKVYSDKNNNGANDTERGLAGWTIQVHQDSLTGPLIGSGLSDVNGLYSVLLPPGIFVASEVPDTMTARLTGPVGGTYTDTVDNITPLHTARDFGNFVYARLRVTLNVDQNGNGTKDVGDIVAVPSGASSSFLLKKGVTPVGAPFSLGNATIFNQITRLDLGVYTVNEVDSIPGWRRTKGGVHTFTVDTSGEADTAVYLDFKYLVIAGTKYNDLNGDGVKDLGEPGLAGWTVNVSGGTYYGATSAVTDGSGNYSIDSVFTGTHTVTEVAQPGWTQTTAAIAPINGISANLIPGGTAGKNFGNFDLTDISGLVYRDYNGNGVKDAEDVVMTGVSIGLASGPSDVTDGSGYSFNGVLTVDTVRITVPGGYVVTQPVAGEYPLALVSGGAAVNRNFGLFQGSDSTTKYRTFTALQLSGDDQKKPGAKPKAGKAYDAVKNKPSTANLVDALINPKTGFYPNAIVVGLPGQLNAGGKTKAYVVPNKQGAFWASLNSKGGNRHDGMARGFDVDVKGKPFLKLQKSFAPGKKQDNKLFGELLALKLNLLASGVSTPANLGVLIYKDPASDFDGWTIDEIADYADTVMTNFEFMPLGIYTALDSIAGKINGAFYHNATDDTANGWASPVLTWKAYTSVFEVPFLGPNPGATPKNRRAPEVPESVPTEFALSQNYPNPFNPTTTIEFDVPQTSLVTLKVYNLLGQEIATLLNKEEVEFSETVEFDASTLPSGVYLYRIVAETVADADAGIAPETFTQVKKMVLVK